MPDVQYEIAEYRVLLYGRKGQSTTDRTRAQIMLLNVGGGGRVVARLYFHDPEIADQKTDSVRSDGTFMSGNMSVTELGAVLDLLRNEKPVYVSWYDWAGMVMLTSGFEPIGEEEL